jgi:hypothetical protein
MLNVKYKNESIKERREFLKVSLLILTTQIFQKAIANQRRWKS